MSWIEVESLWPQVVTGVSCRWCGVGAGEQCVGVYAARPGEPHMSRIYDFANSTRRGERMLTGQEP